MGAKVKAMIESEGYQPKNLKEFKEKMKEYKARIKEQQEEEGKSVWCMSNRVPINSMFYWIA